jgi:hypothetical protein
VNLSSDGLAIVEASVFDDGSYDNCCLDNFEVRRMDGDCQGNPDDFGPTVTFCCEDVAAGEPVMVVFRAYDCEGNFNDCMVSVNLNDKQPPILISCPASPRLSLVMTTWIIMQLVLNKKTSACWMASEAQASTITAKY